MRILCSKLIFPVFPREFRVYFDASNVLIDELNLKNSCLNQELSNDDVNREKFDPPFKYNRQ